jgi:hypothetical protein
MPVLLCYRITARSSIRSSTLIFRLSEIDHARDEVDGKLTTVLSCQPVESIVRLASPPNKSAESVCDRLVEDCLALLVNLGDVDLDRSVVFCGDDLVGDGALARDVEVHDDTLCSAEVSSCVTFLDTLQSKLAWSFSILHD